MKKSFTDQLSRNMEITYPPRRIISLVPSQTELLYSLGLEKEVIGITKFCVHPESWFRKKTRVGGTKQLHIDIIRKLKPDLIIGNKEENEKAQIEELMREFPVWMSEINTLEEASKMIMAVGGLAEKKMAADQLSNTIHQQLNEWQASSLFQQIKARDLKAAYFIWKNPWMVAAGETFINEMIKAAGFINVFGEMNRYPEINMDQLKTANPDIIMLSSEPYPFKEKHLQALQKEIPSVKIILADGEIFSWYGSRMLKAPAYFEMLAKQLSL